MDMKTTVFSYGAAEMSLMVAAMAQMAQHYRLPFFGTAGCSDAKLPDAQAAAEAAFSCLSSALSGANLVHDSGWLDHGSVASPAYMVLVNEILHMVNQFMGGIPLNDESIALELIDKIGPGGHYLLEKHTLEHFRNVWYSDLFDRTIYDQWQAQGAKQFQERLHEQTQKAMEHQPAPLSDDVVQELARMENHWE
jgi:trimethylamine--corrinoid protein Co-methyltransferase